MTKDRDISVKAILLVAAAVYAVWTPVYFLAKPGPIVMPKGERVELILPTGSFDESGRVIRKFGFKQGDESARPFAVYENEKPLPSDHYDVARFNPKNRWRDVKFTASDGSDPRYNGRRYYAVIP